MKQSLVKLLTGIVLAGLFLPACKKDGSEPDNAINSFSLTVQNQLNGSVSTALCLVNLTEGKVYNAADAKNNQAKVDFIYHQYTGTVDTKDSYFFAVQYLKDHPSGYEQNLRDALGIQTWTTSTNSTITRTTELNEADFNAIDNAVSLRDALNGITNTLTVNEFITGVEGQPAATIYAFRATNNKAGLMKLKAARTGTGGSIDVDIKVEK